MSNEWVILELSPKAEGEDPDIVCRSIRSTVRDAEVFIPASVTEIGDDKVVQYLVDGYAFVRRVHPDTTYFRLEGTRYVQTVITHPSTSGPRPIRQVSCITTTDIDRMRRQIQVESDQGISVGDTVRITSGAYKQILAVVIEDVPELDKVLVQVKLRSKESLVTLPRSFLRLVTKAPRPAYLDRYDSLKSWLRMALALASWSDDALQGMVQLHSKLHRLQGWLDQGSPVERMFKASKIETDPKDLFERARFVALLSDWIDRGKPGEALVGAFQAAFDFDTLTRKSAEYARLLFWVDRGKDLTRLIHSHNISPTLSPLETLYTEWLWLEDVAARMTRVGHDVVAMGRVLDVEAGGTVVQNIIIDGHNLSFRCQYAPGMDGLTDSKGRPTGVIVGFIRSLGSLRKRYPGADLYVCWDGSSKKRKAIFPGYKANRGERSGSVGFDQVQWVRELLPYLGVAQMYHDDEEADDMIATLVRTRLAGQRNLIFTTDRDMLQLVTELDNVLIPAVGPRKEILYDCDAVVRDYGVPPSQMVHLRAFLGDSSDNIPGVPRVPAKVLTQLIKLYRTVDGVYASNFAGLTKFQYGRLRESEAQVRLNTRLMGLDTCATFVLVNPDVDQSVVRDRLQDVEMKADPVLTAFFGSDPGFEDARRDHDQRLRDSG